MSWNIVPYTSVGSVQFGMTPDEVAALIGPPEDTQGNPIPASASVELRERYADTSTEFRLGSSPENAKPSIQYESGKVVSFEMYDGIRGVELNGYRLFEHSKREVIAKLIADSSAYVEDEEDYIFLDWGIAMSRDELWDDAPSINVFRRGHFDRFVNRPEARLIRR